MRRLLFSALIAAIIAMICITACKRTSNNTVSTAITKSNFPVSVGTIFINKCATAGCHDASSAQNADGLLLDSWEHLFNGGYDGASVVPYAVLYSPMLYFINTDSTNGIPIAEPTMPISTTTSKMPYLTKAEFDTISNWIARGAPDVNGNIAFSSNPATRQKIYQTQSGCNEVAVIDAKTKLVMRYIAVGSGTNEAQHDVTVSSDGRYAYVSFYIGNIVQKIDCIADTVVATCDMTPAFPPTGDGSWGILTLSPDNSTLMVSGFQQRSCVIAINTATMAVNLDLSIYGGGNYTTQYPYMHGLANNATFDTFYACIEYGNEILKWWYETGVPHFKVVTLNSLPATNASSITPPLTPDPHQIIMSPDYSKYFVTCENSAEVRVLSTANDQLLDSIPVGALPQEMAISASQNYLFVACMEDSTNTNSGSLGSVYVIDINTYAVVKKIYGYFYQPHDIAVDAQDGLLFISSTNISPGGPPPHHIVGCAGRPGWYTVYDLNTLQPADANQYTVLVNPYAISNRF